MARRKSAVLLAFSKLMGAHNAGERIAVGDAKAGEPQGHRRRDEFFGMRGAAQKREIRRRREFGVARRHAKRHGDESAKSHA